MAGRMTIRRLAVYRSIVCGVIRSSAMISASQRSARVLTKVSLVISSSFGVTFGNQRSQVQILSLLPGQTAFRIISGRPFAVNVVVRIGPYGTRGQTCQAALGSSALPSYSTSRWRVEAVRSD